MILYATCSLDPAFLEPYDASVRFTQRIAQLARESLVFERHVTESPVSGIAYASLFTGAQADVHGVYHHPARLAQELVTIFEAFAAAGYETHYFNGHRMASAELDYAQGVAPDRVHPSHASKRDILTAESPAFAALLARLAADPTLHAFVVANFSVTHAAYTAQLEPGEFAEFFERHYPDVSRADLERLGPLYEENRLPLQWDYPRTVARLGLPPEDVRKLARLLEACYAGDVHLLDRIVGRCLDALRSSGLLDETLFAFTADHGEYLFDERHLFQWGHGLQLEPEELSVPWILRAPPGTFAPGRYPGVSRSIDVFPTLAGLCGVPLPAGARVDGADLSAAIRGRVAPPELPGMSHTKVLDERLMREFEDMELVKAYFPRSDPSLMWVGVRERDLYYRWRNAGAERFVLECFDLERDPGASVNLFDEEDREHQRVARWLEGYKQRLVEAYGRAERGVDSQSIEEDLRALGYVR